MRLTPRLPLSHPSRATRAHPPGRRPQIPAAPCPTEQCPPSYPRSACHSLFWDVGETFKKLEAKQEPISRLKYLGPLASEASLQRLLPVASSRPGPPLAPPGSPALTPLPAPTLCVRASSTCTRSTGSIRSRCRTTVLSCTSTQVHPHTHTHPPAPLHFVSHPASALHACPAPSLPTCTAPNNACAARSLFVVDPTRHRRHQAD